MICVLAAEVIQVSSSQLRRMSRTISLALSTSEAGGGSRVRVGRCGAGFDAGLELDESIVARFEGRLLPSEAEPVWVVSMAATSDVWLSGIESGSK